MPSGSPTRVDVGSIRDQMLTRVDVIVRVTARDDAVRLLGRDAGSGRFAGVSVAKAPGSWHPPGVPDGALVRPLALAPDGGRLLLRDPDIGRDRLTVHTLADGATVTLPPGPGSGAIAAAFAPDGDQIAVLALEEDRPTAVVVDVASGRRHLWSTDGATSSESVVTWSPDSRFLAVSYLDPDDADHTVVLDRAGTVTADLPGMAVIGKSRLGWTGDHELVLIHEFWDDPEVPQPLVLVDAATGDRRDVAQQRDEGLFGALDGRVVRLLDGGRVVSTAVDQSDPRLVLDVGPDYAISFLDAIHGALG